MLALAATLLLLTTAYAMAVLINMAGERWLRWPTRRTP